MKKKMKNLWDLIDSLIAVKLENEERTKRIE